MLAAAIGAHDSIPKILDSDRNRNIEARDGHQSTALHLAARNGHVEAVRNLLDKRALLEARGGDKK